jgi:hypothetical protein
VKGKIVVLRCIHAQQKDQIDLFFRSRIIFVEVQLLDGVVEVGTCGACKLRTAIV